ncbi:MAG: hypothetical protein LBJ18_04540 [Rickettsiales bacterium]|jgi:hypothetical protein|nr:hypothetical protein [Rickettsiales bacterium]
MKKLKYFLTFAFCLLPFMAHAVCPVCTVAVGAGLTFLELWGVDLVLGGIWAGGLTLIMVFWTAKWLNRRGVKSAIWYVLDFIVWYGFFATVYLLPNFRFGGDGNTLFGIDKLLLGTVIGTVVLYAAEKWNAKLIRENGGKSRFKFQKVILPFGALAAASAVFAGIIYL